MLYDCGCAIIRIELYLDQEMEAEKWHVNS